MNNDDDRPNNYQVGYGKPPQHTRFKKGRSGNPSGRPKGSRSLKTHLMIALDEKIPVKENGKSRMITKREAAATQLVNRAAMGDLKSIKLLSELLADEERRQEAIDSAADGKSMRERMNKRIQDLDDRIRKRAGLPPQVLFPS